MTLLKDLQSGKYNLVLIGIIIGLLFYCFPNTTEPFADAPVSPSTDPVLLATIKDQIRKIYLADVDSIRNLSEVATKLQTGALTIPGDLTIQGKLQNTDNVNISGNKGLIVSNLEGLTISKATSGTGNLKAEGNIDVGGALNISSTIIVAEGKAKIVNDGSINCASLVVSNRNILAELDVLKMRPIIPIELMFAAGSIPPRAQPRSSDQEIASSGALLVTYKSIIKPLSGTITEYVGGGSGDNDNAWMWMKAFHYKPDMTDAKILYDGYATRFIVSRNTTVTKELTNMITPLTVEAGRVVMIKLYSRRDTDDEHYVYWTSLLFTQSPA